jgi:cell shape-determining protein MreC
LIKLDIWAFFPSICRENWSFIKMRQEKRAWRLFAFMTISCLILLRRTNISKKIVEEVKTHLSSVNFFFLKSCNLWDNIEKYFWAREAADDNIALHAW